MHWNKARMGWGDVATPGPFIWVSYHQMISEAIRVLLKTALSNAPT